MNVMKQDILFVAICPLEEVAFCIKLHPWDEDAPNRNARRILSKEGPHFNRVRLADLRYPTAPNTLNLIDTRK